MVRDSKYIHLYNTQAAHDADYDELSPAYGEPWVAYVPETDKVSYNIADEYNWANEYLTFKALENGTFTFTKALNYSLDDGETWVSLAANTATPTVSAGDMIKFKAQITPASSTGIGTFSSTGEFVAAGNPLSLLYGDNFAEITDISSKTYALYKLFYNNTKIITADKIKLPATTLSNNCYGSMFRYCTSLIKIPDLPATTLANYCYYYMFYGCTALTTAPKLPATTLASSCYNGMFQGCTALTTAPELPATVLASSCYANMFSNCVSIKTAPELNVTTLETYCYNGMFSGCTSLTAAPELPALTMKDYCYSGMFTYCTSITTAPTLPATTLAKGCYGNMFAHCTSLIEAPSLPVRALANECYSRMFAECTSLTVAPELPATTLREYCYDNMFISCTALTTAPELPATTLQNYCYNQMFMGCSSLNYIKAMFTTNPGIKYSQYWVQGVAATGTFIKNSSASWDVVGVNAIPSGWTVETASE